MRPKPYLLDAAIRDAVEILTEYRSSIGAEDHAEDYIARMDRCIKIFTNHINSQQKGTNG